MGPVEQLAALSDERVAPAAAFAVADHVLDAVRRAGFPWGLDSDGYHRWHCPMTGCGRGIILGRNPAGERYRYLPGDMEGLMLAHFIQAHGWSREDIGECG